MSINELMNELITRGIDVTQNRYLEHHDKYLELDGYDETRWVTPKEHREIHNDWRKQGKIIPDKICKAASRRTQKVRLYSLKNKEKYHKKRKNKFITFDTNIEKRIHLREIINYFDNGCISYISHFYNTSGEPIHNTKETNKLHGRYKARFKRIRRRPDKFK